MKSKRYFKYKPIINIIDLERLLEIINHKKIFIPNFQQLNDPFESYAYNIETYTCGSIMQANLLKRTSSANFHFNKLGILSLTKNYRNQMMWALYANQFCGVCICFDNLNGVKPIRYLPTKKIKKLPIITEDKYNEKVAKDSLFIKNKMWEQEQEYRLISEAGFYKLNNNIYAVILGHELPKNIKDVIAMCCKNNNILFYKTYIDFINNKIRIIEYDYYPEYGTKFDTTREVKL